MRVLLVLFIVIPIVEMWLLITVGGVIGIWPTIALVLLTAFIGLTLLKHQGSEALISARAKMQSNQLPAREIADSLFFAVGGALLLTPGFVTDAVGFACLTPGIRAIIIRFFANNIMKPRAAQTSSFSAGGPFSRSGQHFGDQNIIEGDFERAPEREHEKTNDRDLKS